MGRASPLRITPKKVELRRRVPSLEPANRASALISHTDSVAREFRMAAGGDVVMDHDGAEADYGTVA